MAADGFEVDIPDSEKMMLLGRGRFCDWLRTEPVFFLPEGYTEPIKKISVFI